MSRAVTMEALTATATIQTALLTVYAGCDEPRQDHARLALIQIARAHDTLTDALGTLNTEIYRRHQSGTAEDIYASLAERAAARPARRTAALRGREKQA